MITTSSDTLPRSPRTRGPASRPPPRVRSMTSVADAVSVREPGRNPNLVTSASDADARHRDGDPAARRLNDAADRRGLRTHDRPAPARLSATTPLASALRAAGGLGRRRGPGADARGVLDVGVGRRRPAERHDQPEQQQHGRQQDDHLQRTGVAARAAQPTRGHGRSGWGMNRSIGADADDRDASTTDREHLQHVGRDGDGDLVGVPTSAPTCTPDVIEPADSPISRPATAPGSPAAGGRGDRRVLGRRLGDVADVRRRGRTAAPARTTAAAPAARSPWRPTPRSPAAATGASAGHLAGVRVELGDDDQPRPPPRRPPGRRGR